MPDDKRGRDKKARDADKRQRKREIEEELARSHELEPPIEATELADIEDELEDADFPLTGDELIAEVGDTTVETESGSYRLEELIPETPQETFDSPAAVTVQIQRPTVAAAMKAVLEAVGEVPHTELDGSQRRAYERTFRELREIQPDDDDEGITGIRDWVLEQIENEQKLPSSRAVRREAAKYCRSQGYQIRNDQWLGI